MAVTKNVPTEVGSIIECTEVGGGIFILTEDGWLYVSVYTAQSEITADPFEGLENRDLGEVLRVGRGANAYDLEED